MKLYHQTFINFKNLAGLCRVSFALILFFVLFLTKVADAGLPPPPVADFTANPTCVNVGGTVAFTDQSANTPVAWTWTFEGGTPDTSILQNPSIVYNIPGLYDVTLTATNAFGSDTEKKRSYITVGCIPPVVEFSATPTCVNPGDSVSFTDQSTNTSTSRSWLFQGGTPDTSTAKNPTVFYYTPGVYDVTLTATNAAGSTTLTKSAFITVGCSPPVVEFSAVPTCVDVGKAAIFTDESTNNPTGWSWVFQGGTPDVSTEKNPSITYNTEGIYDVALTATNAAGSTTLTKTAYITVGCTTLTANFSITPSNICQGDSVLFTDRSSGTPTSWSWTFEGGNPGISTLQNPTVFYGTAGIYTASLVAGNAGGSDTATQTITVQTCTGIEQPDKENTITVFPSPSAGEYSVESNSELNNIYVFNIFGEKVLELKNIHSAFTTFNIAEFADGIYVVKVTCGNKAGTIKIIKQ